jgi:hypothetical protein
MMKWVVRRRCPAECRTYTSNLKLMLVSRFCEHRRRRTVQQQQEGDDVLVSWRHRGKPDSITHTAASICVIGGRFAWSQDVVRCEPVDSSKDMDKLSDCNMATDRTFKVCVMQLIQGILQEKTRVMAQTCNCLAKKRGRGA